MRLSPRLSASALDRARGLRRNATDAETRLWAALRETFAAAKFRRQVPFGCYFADFASHGARLIIEVDGGQHAEAAEHDQVRTAFLNGEGYKVLRFWNNEVLENLDGVLAVIASSLSSALSPLVGESGERGVPAAGRRAAKPRTPHPLPSPTRGEGGSVKSVDLESV